VAALVILVSCLALAFMFAVAFGYQP